MSEGSKTKKDVCIGGDFNINIRKSCPEKELIENWALDFHMKQHVKENTWERLITNPRTGILELKQSVLDLVFTNCEGTTSITDKYTSDHKCILYNFRSSFEEVKRHKIKRRTYKGYNPEIISGKVTQGMLMTSFTGDPEFDSNLLTNTIIDTLDELHPLRTIRTSRPSDIIDQELEKNKKRRKRLLKKYHKEPSHVLLGKIEQLNKNIKKQIHQAKQRQLRLRLEGQNPRSFWNAVAELEGKRSDDMLSLTVGGMQIEDPAKLVEEFGDFFLSKVQNLSGNSTNQDYKIGHSRVNITSEEVIKAAKKLKPKLCHGEDNIPMKVIKDLAIYLPDVFATLFNSCCELGIPADWMVAIVKPLHKSGPKDQVSNYRPISNLNSVSKLFEKTILGRLDDLGELDGKFQHGFKKNRSTTTAMIELQDFISTELDKGKIVGTYSIDLSAAFDLLRPNMFHQMMQNKIPCNLLQVLMDFLSDRSFKVSIDGSKSITKNLSVGCVQGSILGPRLFTLYLGELERCLPMNTHIVSYADDTYISTSNKDLEELKTTLSDTMERHDQYLKSIGMVTNVNKTELIYFAKNDINDITPIKVGNDYVTPKKTIKVLGVHFDSDLKWNSHASKLKGKAAMTMRKLRFLGRYIDIPGMKKIVTTHLFGMLYYASPVWFNELTSFKILNTLNIVSTTKD